MDCHKDTVDSRLRLKIAPNPPTQQQMSLFCTAFPQQLQQQQQKKQQIQKRKEQHHRHSQNRINHLTRYENECQSNFHHTSMQQQQQNMSHYLPFLPQDTSDAGSPFFKSKLPQFYPVDDSLTGLAGILESAADACADVSEFTDKDFKEVLLSCWQEDVHQDNESMYALENDPLMPNSVFLESTHSIHASSSASVPHCQNQQITTGREFAGLDKDAIDYLSLIFSKDADRNAAKFTTSYFPNVGSVVGPKSKKQNAAEYNECDVSFQPTSFEFVASAVDSEKKKDNVKHSVPERAKFEAGKGENIDRTNKNTPMIRDYHKSHWDLMYKELCEFRNNHGHCLVSLTDEENVVLARWIKRQRYQYKLFRESKRCAMTQERVELLESVGFIWEAQESQWYERLQELKDFKKANGHCIIPTTYTDNLPLATWAKCQRRQYKLYKENRASNISEKRVLELEKVGFQWNLRCSKRQRTS